jgi:hypothetical protein
LYLGANPPGTAPLELYDEARTIKRELREARHRCFELVSCWASEAYDLLRELRESLPVIAHLGVHGCEDAECEGGLVLHARDGSIHVVSYELVRKIFELVGSSVKLVVVTACATEPLARLLLAHVDCAIGMDGPITDPAALAFTRGLYAAIGDGASIDRAFRAGCLAIQCAGLPGEDRPKLKVRDGVDASQIVLAAIPSEHKASGHRWPRLLPSFPGTRRAQRGTRRRRGKFGAQRPGTSARRGKRNRATRRRR